MTDRQEFDRQTAYSQLYEVMQTDAPLMERLHDALEVGVEQFGVDLGYIARVDQETDDWEIIVNTDPDVGPDPTGLREDLSNTYCLRTIREETVVSFPDAAAEGLEDHPSAVDYGISCYHGAPIVVDNEPYGTVCFSSYDPRAEPFSEAERSFSHLLAQMAGYEIDQQQYERELTEWEERLNERSEIYRAVIDASFDLVFRLDREGRITYASETTVSFLGYEAGALDGQSFAQLVSTETAIERAWKLFDRILSGETVEEHYLPLETETGEIVYTDIRGTPIYDSTVPPEERTPEDIVAVQGMSRDATDRKRREGLISVINRVLRHNLRNDVGVINGYAEMLEGELEGQQETLARRVRTTASRLIDLSETAQKLERNLDVPSDRQPVDLRSLADRVANEIRDSNPEASITVTAPERLVVDSSPRLETALWELLDNAAKHAGDEPTIGIDIENTGDRTVISVRDDGPGLPELERSVLESGEETPLVHGSGLGLWLVYWIVTGVDGTLDVVDSPIPGTTIEIGLPKSSTVDHE